MTQAPTTILLAEDNPTIVEVVVHAPYAARRFEPGQFYRLQNFERFAPVIDGTRLAIGGASAGGNLAAAASLRLAGEGRPPSASLPSRPIGGAVVLSSR